MGWSIYSKRNDGDHHCSPFSRIVLAFDVCRLHLDFEYRAWFHLWRWTKRLKCLNMSCISLILEIRGYRQTCCSCCSAVSIICSLYLNQRMSVQIPRRCFFFFFYCGAIFCGRVPDSTCFFVHLTEGRKHFDTLNGKSKWACTDWISQMNPVAFCLSK